MTLLVVVVEHVVMKASPGSGMFLSAFQSGSKVCAVLGVHTYLHHITQTHTGTEGVFVVF